jgi:hypothetical protein
MGLINESNQAYYDGNNLGGYQYISIIDIINNFIVAYVGDGKLIDDVKRTDVMFHAKRALQEFSYDTLKSYKSIEVEVGPNLAIPIPQDYVNYVKIVWVDNMGIERVLYPTRLHSNPNTIPLQDNNYEYLYDNYGEMLQGDSLGEQRWNSLNPKVITGDDGYSDKSIYYDYYYFYKRNTGGRYGLTPETSQNNGFFTINDRDGVINFSSDLNGRVVTVKYISDGLGTDEEMQVHKLAEQAMYMYMCWAILSTKANTPEYIINRYKKEKSAAIRNAKIRLSNIKLEEISQVMRNKSKILKH